MLKVLLIAYECSPYRGSEWAVGWGRLLEGSRVAQMHVLTSEDNFGALKRAQDEGLLPPEVRFYTPEPDARLRAESPAHGAFAYNYTAYHHWHKLAIELARSLHAQEHFDLVHQATVNTFREPGYGYELGIPFLWGPVGGSQNYPMSFLSLLPPKEAAKEAARAIANKYTLYRDSRVRRAARRAAKIYASNSTNQRDYERAWGRKVHLLLETGLRDVPEPDHSRFERRLEEKRRGDQMGPLELLWSGELQTRKALPILLRALSKARKQAEFRLTVLGDGPMRELWTAEAERLGLQDIVRFAGRLPFPEAVAAMNHADLFCFTSLRDTSGNVVLEAMAAGVPVLCFGHQGTEDMVDATCGVRLPVVSPKRAIEDWRQALIELAENAEKLLAMSWAAPVRAREFLWSRNGDVVNEAYLELGRTNMEKRLKLNQSACA